MGDTLVLGGNTISSTQFAITLERNEIKAQLEDVSGIGAVYLFKANPTDEEAFKAKFADQNSIINFCEVTLSDGLENTDSEESVTSEDGEFQQIRKDNSWQIDLFYGYKYDETTPSELAFQTLIEAIEAQFRFLQDLNGQAFRSQPLQRVSAGLWQMAGGMVLCHKASWRLTVTQLIQNPN